MEVRGSYSESSSPTSILSNRPHQTTLAFSAAPSDHRAAFVLRPRNAGNRETRIRGAGTLWLCHVRSEPPEGAFHESKTNLHVNMHHVYITLIR
eukprot:1195531-Prorocentrum_minimum.AAC.2